MGISQQVGASSLNKPGVCTSTTRPATPYEGQMIYETDTDRVLVWNGSAWYANWNLPWGIVAYASSTTAFNCTTIQVATGMSVTFTAVANRYYRITYTEPEIDFAATAGQYFYQRLKLDNASGTLLNTNVMQNPAAYAAGNSSTIIYTTSALSAGSKTIVGTLSANTGTISVYRNASDFVAQLTVEDIGPA